MGTMINVSKETRDRVNSLKRSLGFRNVDSTIRAMLSVAEKGDGSELVLAKKIDALVDAGVERDVAEGLVG